VQPAAPLPPAPEEHISVEIGVPATPARALAPPPPPPPMEAPAPQAAVARAPAAPPPAPAAPPAPVAPPAATAPAAAAEAVAEPRADAERAREQATMRMAPVPAPAGASSADASEPATLESISVFGSRVGDVQAATVVAEDSRAGPQTWIQRIRARIDRGDTEGARQSLQGFIERYPRKPLPQDLIDFGQGNGVEGLPRGNE
jgi:outer membrane receptor protein involved in Fe transport